MKSTILFFFAIITTSFAHSQMLDFSIPVDNLTIETETTPAAVPAPLYQLPPATAADTEHLMFQNRVKVPAGTQIMFKTNERIPAARLVDGQMIRLKVVSDVIVDGKVVIRANTQAMGIARVELPVSAQSEGQVMIEVMNTQDIQGQTILLSSDPNYVTSQQPGMAADLPLGRMVTATVQNNIEVSLK